MSKLVAFGETVQSAKSLLHKCKDPSSDPSSLEELAQRLESVIPVLGVGGGAADRRIVGARQPATLASQWPRVSDSLSQVMRQK